MPRPRLPIRPDEKIRPIAARDDLIHDTFRPAPCAEPRRCHRSEPACK